MCVCGGGEWGIRLHRWVCVRSSMGACVVAVAASRIPSATRLCHSRLSGVVAEPMAENPESRRGRRRHQHRRTLHPGENCGEKEEGCSSSSSASLLVDWWYFLRFTPAVYLQTSPSVYGQITANIMGLPTLFIVSLLSFPSAPRAVIAGVRRKRWRNCHVCLRCRKVCQRAPETRGRETRCWRCEAW